MKSILPAYLAFMSLCAFVLCGVDKGRAKKGAWRIPEGTLLLTAALGGSLGLLLGMRLFHHKTRKKRFTVTVPLLLILQLLGLVWLYHPQWILGLLGR